MKKIWKLMPKVPGEVMGELSGLSPLVIQLLYNRNFTNKADVQKTLSLDYNNLYDPFLFTDMDRAVERIWQAIIKGEKIVVYGDYDADAVTAVAVMLQTFRYLGVRAESYIPDRFTEGYGLNLEAFAKIKEQGATLIITVDCGTNSVDVAKYCQSVGLDLIITDHHEMTGPTPEAYALINPKRPGEQYPDHQITGVGVAFKVVQGILANEARVTKHLAGQNQEHKPGFEKWLLDLVSIGTVADCHSLMGENRIFVSFGLKVLEKTRWPGMRALLASVGKQTKPDVTLIGFQLAPRINAAGRLEHASIALDLLLSQTDEEALALAEILDNINKRRQELTKRLISEASEIAETMLDRKILLMSGTQWPKGVVGIVAGRIAEKYARPTIILEQGESESTGSARTYGDFNWVEALGSASALLTKYGGHKQAAGLSLPTANIDKFYAELLRFAEQHSAGTEIVSTLELEAELGGGDLTTETFEAISALEPYGAGNPRPKFLVKGASLVSSRLVGSVQNHLQAVFSVDGSLLESIGFNQSRLYDTINQGTPVHLAGELMAEEWNGNRKIKLRILDIKHAHEETDYLY